MSKPVHPRRLGAAAIAVDEYLRSLGIDDAVFVKAKHVQVEFSVGPHTRRMSLSCTPKDDTAAAHQAVRRVKKIITEACAA